MRTCSAQTSESALEEVRFQSLPAQYDHSTFVVAHAVHQTLLLWSSQNPDIAIATFDATSSSFQCSPKHINFVFDEVCVSDTARSTMPQLFFLNRRSKTVTVVTDYASDTLRASAVIHLPYPVAHLLVGDVNNDGRPDVLVYDRNTPGILPFLATSTGGYRQGPPIAQDNPIAAAVLVPLNNDNLIDLVIFDWVKSELHMLYGVGKGRFLDQSVFPVHGDIDQIIPASFFRHPTTDLVLVSHKRSELQFWEGNDFGDFTWKKNIAVDNQLVDVAVGDLDNNGLNDLAVTIHPSALEVIHNADEEPFTDVDVFAAGEEAASVQVLTLADSSKQCVVLDKKKKQLVFHNSVHGISLADTAYLAAGLTPTAICANDFNGDGISDLVVANTGSDVFSFYFGHKNTGMYGPISYSLPASPQFLATHSSADSSLRLVVSYPQANQISYIKVDNRNRSLSNASIMSEGASQIISETSSNGLAEFVSLNMNGDAGCSLSFFNQLEGSSFLERTFRLSAPDYLLGAMVADVNRDRNPDILFVYRTGDTAQVNLAVANGDSSFSFHQRALLRDFSLPNVKSVYLWLVQFDDDTVPSIILYAGEPANEILISKGDTNNTFDDPRIICAGIKLEDRSCVQFVDIDHDGKLDLVAGASSLGGIVWFKGLGHGNFEGQQLLVREPRLSHFAIGDFDGDGWNDIALTLPNEGVIKIINGKILFSESAKE
ncbi:MAG TPA: VCBS repeat-containing protein [Bacteroidota bacterium]|nr:VCBS repeat-containing protein [Bacteroidota bacterium]